MVRNSINQFDEIEEQTSKLSDISQVPNSLAIVNQSTVSSSPKSKRLTSGAKFNSGMRRTVNQSTDLSAARFSIA